MEPNASVLGYSFGHCQTNDEDLVSDYWSENILKPWLVDTHFAGGARDVYEF